MQEPGVFSLRVSHENCVALAYVCGIGSVPRGCLSFSECAPPANKWGRVIVGNYFCFLLSGGGGLFRIYYLL